MQLGSPAATGAYSARELPAGGLFCLPGTGPQARLLDWAGLEMAAAAIDGELGYASSLSPAPRSRTGAGND